MGTPDEIANLKFRNPGPSMGNFVPEKSGREMRKINRRNFSQTKKSTMYDEQGLLVAGGRDLCDCLELACPGCHYPCKKCRSQKCGAECRVMRRWVYQEVEIEGSNERVVFKPAVHQRETK